MFLNKKEEPLYIGISTNLTTRIEVQHFKSSNGNVSELCIKETHNILYHVALSADDMKIKERYLINILNPKFNKSMNNKNSFEFKIDIVWKNYDLKIENSKMYKSRKSREISVLNSNLIFERNNCMIKIGRKIFIYTPKIDELFTCVKGDYFKIIEYSEELILNSKIDFIKVVNKDTNYEGVFSSVIYKEGYGPCFNTAFKLFIEKSDLGTLLNFVKQTVRP